MGIETILIYVMVYTYRQTITLKIVAKDLCDLVDTPKAMFGIQGCHFGSQLHLALFGLPLSKDHLTKSAVYGPTDKHKRGAECADFGIYVNHTKSSVLVQLDHLKAFDCICCSFASVWFGAKRLVQRCLEGLKGH